MGHNETSVERFHATNGRASGYAGLACAGALLVLSIAAWDAGTPLGIAIAAALGGVLVWAVMLRPAVWATRDELVMRNIFHTDHIPLGRVDKVAVGQVLAVSVAGKRYISPVIGYSARQTIRQRAAQRTGAQTRPMSAADTYQVFVEERITHLAREHRDLHGRPEHEVRRTWAWPELAGVAVLAAALLAWFLV